MYDNHEHEYHREILTSFLHYVRSSTPRATAADRPQDASCDLHPGKSINVDEFEIHTKQSIRFRARLFSTSMV